MLIMVNLLSFSVRKSINQIGGVSNVVEKNPGRMLKYWYRKNGNERHVNEKPNNFVKMDFCLMLTLKINFKDRM